MPLGFKGFQKGHSIWVGRKLSEETKRKIGEKNTKYGDKFCIKCKKKIYKYNKQSIRCRTCANIIKNKSTKMRRLVAESKFGVIREDMLGDRNPAKREDVRKKLSEGQLGEKHWNWKGGKSFEPYPVGWNKTFKEQIRYRDGYRCQICGCPEIENGKRLDVHHINYDKQNITEINLVSLCKPCHMGTNKNREWWKEKLTQEKNDRAKEKTIS